jgi:hypothetical protein
MQAAARTVITAAELDRALTAQIAIAWAGEAGEERRLGWWRSDMVSEFGGEDLFRRLLPQTWQWAVLQAVREAARRRDAELRAQDHDPDRILSLYSLGFEVDERVDERLVDLKRSGRPPAECLPGLGELLSEPWRAETFGAWIRRHGTADTVVAPVGRRVKGSPPESLELLVQRLVAACWPLSDAYPLPHYRKSP